MNKKYIVYLSDAERAQLTELTRKGKAAAFKKGVDWQFSTQDAPIKLKLLYPQVQS